MNGKPLVSVIVPCYKQAEYLSECLDSVIAQTYQNWECIVVDDGSPDNTAEVAKDFCSRDTRIKYLFQQNAGVAAARNNGIKASNGLLILPLDGDDMIAPEYLELAVNVFVNNPEVSVVYSRSMKFGVSNGLWKMPPYAYETIIWGNVIPNTAMYKRADYDKTQGYNSNLIYGYEDWDFWLSLLTKDSIVETIEDGLYKYRTKLSSRAVDNDVQEHWIASHRQIYLNHPEIYSQYVQDIIILHNKEQELRHVLGSKAYRLGERIASFYRKLRYAE